MKTTLARRLVDPTQKRPMQLQISNGNQDNIISGKLNAEDVHVTRNARPPLKSGSGATKRDCA